MFGCALVYTVPATSAFATCPVTFEPANADKPAPLPLTLDAAIAPVNVMLLASMLPFPDDVFANTYPKSPDKLPMTVLP